MISISSEGDYGKPPEGLGYLTRKPLRDKHIFS